MADPDTEQDILYLFLLRSQVRTPGAYAKDRRTAPCMPSSWSCQYRPTWAAAAPTFSSFQSSQQSKTHTIFFSVPALVLLLLLMMMVVFFFCFFLCGALDACGLIIARIPKQNTSRACQRRGDGTRRGNPRDHGLRAGGAIGLRLRRAPALQGLPPTVDVFGAGEGEKEREGGEGRVRAEKSLRPTTLVVLRYV